VGLLVAILLPRGALSRTWVVSADGSGDAPSVQAGIDSSAVGDTVLILPGVYQETIDYSGKDIVVRSQSGPDETIIDASSLGTTAVSFVGGETRSAILEGLTITGGVIGVLISSSEPTVVSCTISNNTTPAGGAGFLLGGAPPGRWSPLITRNRIIRNVAAGSGGGMFISDLMTAEITANIISENEAVSGDGGGIFYRGRYDGGVIRNNIIMNNRAGDKGGGILVSSLVQYMSVEVSWNLIAGNVSNSQEQTGNSGGGIKLAQTNAWVHHNTIVNNSGYGTTDSQGGGIVAYFGGSPVIEKNIIALSGVGGGIWCDAMTTPIIRNNLAWQNQPADGVGDCPTWWQSDGNIVTDPYFCDPASGDYSVAQNSPALTNPYGPLGAFRLPGCGPVAVTPTTWGRIKALYGRPGH
jgi:hypothetical protein